MQQEIEIFFSDLYKGDIVSPSENMLNPFLKNPDVLKLSQVDAQVCDGKRTVSQCWMCVKGRTICDAITTVEDIIKFTETGMWLKLLNDFYWL